MNIKKMCVLVMLIVCLLIAPVGQIFAIGQWVKGTVTKSPWHGTYTYLSMDDVKYTIMKDVKIMVVYKKNGAEYKDKIQLSAIYKGDSLLIQVEGNRIYQIEKIR